MIEKVVSVAIHQPNFLPWLGYFHKIINSDIFIVLDDVQIQKKSGSWTNRVQIIIDGMPRWLSAPIGRKSGATQTVNQTKFADLSWFLKCHRTIDMAYNKAPHHKKIMNLIDELFDSPSINVAQFNEKCTYLILQFLELKTPRMIHSSTLNVIGSGTDRLINLINTVGGSQYLCGGGSESYLEPEKFLKASIQLSMQNFKSHEYPQLKTEYFIPGLSIIDVLMMIGPKLTVEKLLV
jgi:hypothetical protein